MIVADEMRGDVINNSFVQTPNIDSIVEDGVAFTNNFSVNPVCAPSRVCTFTGQYPHNGGHRSLYQLLRPHDENLFKMLKEQGYDVVWVGRNDLFHEDAVKKSVNERIPSSEIMMRKIGSEISRKIGKLKTLRMFKNLSSILNDKKSLEELKEAIAPYIKLNPYPLDHPLRKSFYYGEKTKLQAEYDFDQVIMEEALKYLDKFSKSKRDKPLCLYIAFAYPHPPYTVEEPYFSMYDREKVPIFSPESEGTLNYDDKPMFMKLLREHYGLDRLTNEDFREIRAVYYGMISKLDNQIGQILNKMKEIGIYEKTAIIFFADHGDYAGSYGLTEKWPTGMQDCLLNVPLIVKLPGVKSSAKFNDQLTQTIDIFPTLLEVAQIDTPYTHFGKSLIPVMKGEVESHRDVVFAEGGYDPREPQAFEDVVDSFENPFIGIYYDKTNIPVEKPEASCRTVMIRT
ncbi:MAG: sulfatase-like hydrolase/transferase, partial [Promethearchaeota archaeon]